MNCISDTSPRCFEVFLRPGSERIFFLFAALFLAAFLLAVFSQFVPRCDPGTRFAPSRPAPALDSRFIVAALRFIAKKMAQARWGPAPPFLPSIIRISNRRG